jgi:hypothetical protein
VRETTKDGTNKIKVINNNTKQQQLAEVLLLLGIHINPDDLVQSYNETRILEVCEHMKKNTKENPSGFLLDALKKNYDLKTRTTIIKEKRVYRKMVESEQEASLHREKLTSIHKIDQWITKNQ